MSAGSSFTKGWSNSTPGRGGPSITNSFSFQDDGEHYGIWNRGKREMVIDSEKEYLRLFSEMKQTIP